MGSFVELREGQEVEFEDGKRYIVRVDGETPHDTQSAL